VSCFGLQENTRLDTIRNNEKGHLKAKHSDEAQEDLCHFLTVNEVSTVPLTWGSSVPYITSHVLTFVFKPGIQGGPSEGRRCEEAQAF
jgi:hypothetical protein